ncbi:type 2 lanthipeptide synthetase LanM [Streptomyces olivaceus]|uniref:type 2 lanthipeptide synthetase LanM n=1 Tax=Streptomyces olivaceus TaxID=47716 RepID=UPI0033B503C4
MSDAQVATDARPAPGPTAAADAHVVSEPQVAVEDFLPFYRNRIPRQVVVDRLRGPLSQVAAPEHAGTLVDQVWEDLVTAVEGHSLRVLIGEFHEFRQSRGLPATAGSDEAISRFRRHIEDPDNCRELLGRYDVLRRRLTVVLDRFLDAYDDLFTAFRDDRPRLVERGLLTDGGDTLASLITTGGDPHNDNRRVVGVRLAGGGRLVFKPRTLAADDFVRDLYAVVDPYLAHSLSGCVPESLSVGDHGWQSFVTPRAMTAPDQPARYFYRFGALCALFGAIGASDLHDENLLAAGEHPCVIDTEMMLRPGSGTGDGSLEQRLNNHVEASVASTMLVPNVRPESPIDVIMAGVGVSGEQVSGKMKKSALQDGGTDALRLRWEPIVYQHKENVPRLGDEKLASVRFYRDIVAGYTDALGAVRERRAIEEVIDRYAELPVRCLIRSTMVYGRFLDAATQPRYLRDAGESKRFLGLLKQFPRQLAPEARAFVGEAERVAMDTGNVPYFTGRAGTTELATHTDRLPGAHPSSPADAARAGLALHAAQSDRYHRFVLEECFGELAEAAPDVMSAQSVFAPVLDTPAGEPWWPHIARILQDTQVTYSDADGVQCGWVGGVGPDRGVPTLLPGNYLSFHDNGGIVTFLQDAAERDPRFAELYRRADRGLSALLQVYDEAQLRAPESVFTGAASMMLTRPRRQDRAWTARLLERVPERIEAGTLEKDLANGPAGLLMAVLARLEAGQDRLMDEEQLGRLCDLVLGQAGTPLDRAWYDVAHGDVGMWWAVSRVGRYLGDAALSGEAADRLTERLSDGELPPVPGWCNGSAGVLLVSAEILTSAGRPEVLTGGRLAELVDGATSSRGDRPVDLSVCHGSSGVVQSLIATSRLLEDRSLLGRAAEYREQTARAAGAGGFHTGCPGRTSLLGYMFGWSGIGHTDLMLDEALAGRAPAFVPVALTAAGATEEPVPSRRPGADVRAGAGR